MNGTPVRLRFRKQRRRETTKKPRSASPERPGLPSITERRELESDLQDFEDEGQQKDKGKIHKDKNMDKDMFKSKGADKDNDNRRDDNKEERMVRLKSKRVEG